MSSLNPIENGLTSDEEQEAPETLSNPSPPPSETIERVEDILERVENYNSVTQNILESSGLSNTSPEVNIVKFSLSLSLREIIIIVFTFLQHHPPSENFLSMLKVISTQLNCDNSLELSA